MSEQRLFSQKDAAHYLGLSVRYFRDHVHVEPIPVGDTSADKRPLLRYTRESLDAVADAWAKKAAS